MSTVIAQSGSIAKGDIVLSSSIAMGDIVLSGSIVKGLINERDCSLRVAFPLWLDENKREKLFL